MNEELRAMTLSLAVEWAKSWSNGQISADTVIETAKKFEAHIVGSGLTAGGPPIFGGH